MEQEKKISVKNLVISFRTMNGKVQAVRNVSFDVLKGETVAIVGESGSGKSVTSRAIMGILAPNAIVEGGKIIYDGQDLMTIKEEAFHKIRGDKIAMIFQDPMSSLNPIMKVGKQLTEAMLLKGRASQTRARNDFNSRLKLLNACMDASYGAELTPELKAKHQELCKTFDAFCISATKLEDKYNSARRKVMEVLRNIKDILFLDEKKQKIKVKEELSQMVRDLIGTYNPFVIDPDKSELPSLVAELKKEIPSGKAVALTDGARDLLVRIQTLLAAEKDMPDPNFFRIGYYIYRHPDFDLKSLSIPELNELGLQALEGEFMKEFLAKVERALIYEDDLRTEKKREAVKALSSAIEHIDELLASPAEFRRLSEPLFAAVEDAINHLDILKDNAALIFRTGACKRAATYFSADKSNPKEQKRYDSQMAKYNARVAKGDVPDWKVIPLSLIDQTAIKEQMVSEMLELKAEYEDMIAKHATFDAKTMAVGLVDYFKELASAVVYKVTRALAKMRALNLLEEVGIPEPKVRYNQYPFEFSGGMRQRIVIAIALSANPDILICDEPTTALDVTIQSQILELINRLKEERHLSVIFITHDLGVVANMADKIAVMYAGKIVEFGTADEIFYDPRHPYTWALLSSMPDLDTNEKLEAIPGTPPNMIYPPVGDAFAERNKYALEIDYEMQPPMFPVEGSDTHIAATWLLHPDAPKVAPPKIVTDRINRMKNAGGNQ